MLKRFFTGPRARAAAHIIDKLASAAFALNEATDRSPHRFFMVHPMVTRQNSSPDKDGGAVHRFYLVGPKVTLDIMAHEGSKHWIVLMPQEDFLGASIQATARGRFLVSLHRPLSEPAGKLATNLIEEFVRSRDAINMDTPFV